MRIVSNNSNEDLNRRRLEVELRQAIKKMAANLIRITRGAGKPAEIGHQAQQILDVIDSHEEVLGTSPGRIKYPATWMSGFIIPNTQLWATRSISGKNKMTSSSRPLYRSWLPECSVSARSKAPQSEIFTQLCMKSTVSVKSGERSSPLK
jgi:hypothetical protein